MDSSNYRVRRATLDDLPQLTGLWQAMHFSSEELGKRSMWRALSEIANYDPRVAGFDYEALAARAQEQFARAEEYRLRLAVSAFAPERARTGGGSA